MVLNPSPYSQFHFEDHYLDILNAKRGQGKKLGAAKDVEHGQKVALSLAKKLNFLRDISLEWLTPEECYEPGPVIDWMPAVKGMTMVSKLKIK